MSAPAVRVEGVSKRYRLGSGAGAHRTLRDAIGEKLPRWLPGSRSTHPPADATEFWALRDVSFEVGEGERVGIIGRNGAGKSTLLKVLCRITEPTQGRVEIFGRVASLLEVGTGFHPELTGRENVFLNGAILGMTRAEIRASFDEIVAFSEIEPFIDTPVKRYSSGMYVRLAFAVAAHLRSEILIVDEVLAVGDLAFQRKCLGKIRDVSRHGRTVLFVSHSLEAIHSLTTRCVFLADGRARGVGPTAEVVEAYVSALQRMDTRYVARGDATAPGFESIEVQTSLANGMHSFGEPLRVRFAIRRGAALSRFFLSFQVCDVSNKPITHVWVASEDLQRLGDDLASLTCTLPAPKLFMGRYFVTAHLSEGFGKPHIETVEGACSFEVSMHGRSREYPWRANDCVYLEDAAWSSDAPG
jgi:lipopolysaccharide transport system ATP-binding protein